MTRKQKQEQTFKTGLVNDKYNTTSITQYQNNQCSNVHMLKKASKIVQTNIMLCKTYAN